MSQSQKLMITFFLLFLSFSNKAMSKDTKSIYDQVFIEKDSIAERENRVGLFIGSEIDNAYFDNQIYSVQYERVLNSYFNLLAEASFFKNELNTTYKALSENKLTIIKATSVKTQISSGVYFKPLFGEINLLSYKTIPFQLGPKLSVGAANIESLGESKNVVLYQAGVMINFDLSKDIQLKAIAEESFRKNILGTSENLSAFKMGVGYQF